MIAQRTFALISYNDSNKDPGNRDYALANRLANYLRHNGVDAEIKGYSNIGNLNANSHQWLILIPSLGMEASPLMTKTVDAVLDQVVKRRMKGVLAVTTGADLPTKWITIRKYDASEPNEVDNALQGVLRAMQYTKITYTEAKTIAQNQQTQQAAVAQQQKKTRIMRVGLALAAIILIVAALGGVFLLTFHPAPSVIIVPPTVPPTLQGYSYYTQGQPTIDGFQSTQWAKSPTCKLTNSSPPNYQAIMNTKGNYSRCVAKNLKFKNFALQVTMSIKGDAGGVIFRDDGHGTYYRLAFNQSAGTYSVYFCRSSVCDTSDPNIGSVNNGTPLLPAASVSLEVNKPITFTIIVIDNNIDLYKDNSLLTSLSTIPSVTTSNTSILVPTPTPTPTSAPTLTPTNIPSPTLTPTPTNIPSSGYIGVYAAALGNDTNVTFSNLKVWKLSDTLTPTPTPPQQNNRKPN